MCLKWFGTPQKKAILKTAFDQLQAKWNELLEQKQKEQPTAQLDDLKNELFKSEQYFKIVLGHLLKKQ